MTDAQPLFRRKTSATDQVSDLVDSVKAYAQQETLGPLKGAARWLAMGSLAALSLGLAMVFGAMAVLRLSQDLGGTTLDGSWSFLHYFITLGVMSLLVWLTFSRISKKTLAKGE